jgi:hypothetical protein
MKRRPMPLFEETSRTIFQRLDNWSSIVERLADLRLKNREVIQLAIVGSRQKLPELLASKRESPVTSIKLVKTSEHLWLFRFTRKFGGVKPQNISGEFLIVRHEQPNMYIVLFIAEARVWRDGILPLLDSLYPKAVRPFLTQKELHTLIRNVQTAIRGQQNRLRILELSSKKRLTGVARKRFQSVREWTDADVDSVFEEAREQNVWFQRVGFEVVAEKSGRISSTGIRGKLSKYGYFRCNGQFDLFERVLVEELLRFSAERLQFFSERDRVSTADHTPRPVQISYESEIFKSSKETKRLVESLRRFRHGTCTMLHANPYIHLSLVDNIDYSSADVWVLSQNQILIVPQMRASSAALKRIVNHIFEYFREGTISEFQTQT